MNGLKLIDERHPEAGWMLTAQAETCRWWALCGKPATHRRRHRAFPDGVPICEDCEERIRQIEEDS